MSTPTKETHCERCGRRQMNRTRRHRCDTCKRLVCGRCANAGGRGQGQGSVRWAECHDCQKTRESTHNP